MRLPTICQGIVLMAMLSSCYYNKRLVYLQNTGFSDDHVTKVNNIAEPYVLQVHDVLSVKIKSTADDEVSSTFNITSEAIGTSSAPGVLYVDGYSIDNDGQVTLPVLGSLKVGGLTLEAARDSIQSRANRYLNRATVLLKLVSFKVTVLGEVKNPGYHYVFNNQATVLEALGLAGDLTSFGNRTNVKLIRPVPGGSEVVLLDITDPALLESPYFYMHPNDVLYVEPLRATSQRSNLDVWGVIFSAATTAILVMGYISTID